jgi:hypothetical protein
MKVTNHVGTTMPKDEEMVQQVSKLQETINWLRSWGIVLSGDEKHAMPKPKPGAEKHMELVHDLAKDRSISIAGLSLDGMKADIEVAAKAQKVEEAATIALQIAADTRYAAQSEAYQAFLAYYGVLSSMADRDPELKKRLAPVVDLLSTGSRKKQAK